jgi:hypothetical protein
MSVLKYKDARGNWVEAPQVYCGGQLKVDVIECATDTTYDLRKYANGRFFMFYTANKSRMLFDSAQPDGIRYFIDSDADTWYLGLWNIFGGNNNGAIATNEEWSASGNPPSQAYTYEDGIFTWFLDNAGECEVGGCAVVIYAE